MLLERNSERLQRQKEKQKGRPGRMCISLTSTFRESVSSTEIRSNEECEKRVVGGNRGHEFSSRLTWGNQTQCRQTRTPEVKGNKRVCHGFSEILENPASVVQWLSIDL